MALGLGQWPGRGGSSLAGTQGQEKGFFLFNGWFLIFGMSVLLALPMQKTLFLREPPVTASLRSGAPQTAASNTLQATSVTKNISEGGLLDAIPSISTRNEIFF